MEIPYTHDMINGKLISYYPNGKPEYIRKYENNILLSVSYFDTLGNQLPNNYSSLGKSRITHFQNGIAKGSAFYKNGKFKKYDPIDDQVSYFVNIDKKAFLPNLTRWE